MVNGSPRQRSVSRTRSAALTAALLLSAACAADRPSADSGDDAEARRLTSVVDLSIGTLDGEDAYVFGRVGGLALDEAGRIIVVDQLAHEVRVFDPEGRFLFRFGREGAGPGELRTPCCAAFGPDGLLWIREAGNARYSAFALGEAGAEFRTSVRIEHGGAAMAAPLTFDPDGRLIDVGTAPDPKTGLPRTVRYHRDGATSDVAFELAVPEPTPDSIGMFTIRREAPNQRTVLFVYQPFGPRHLVAHAPHGEWARTVTSRYALTWYAPDGKPLRTIERALAGPPLTDAERARADSTLDDMVRRLSVSRRDLPFGVPTEKPPIRELFFDRVGRLWVVRYVPQGAPNEADVYEASGKRAAIVTWPAGIVLTNGWAVYRDVALGVQRDELDVERVVRLRLEE